MSSVKEAVYIHCGTKMGVFKPKEITTFSYMHSRGFFACPGCGVKVSIKIKEDSQHLSLHLLRIMPMIAFIKNSKKSSLRSTRAKAFLKLRDWEICYQFKPSLIYIYMFLKQYRAEFCSECIIIYHEQVSFRHSTNLRNVLYNAFL